MTLGAMSLIFEGAVSLLLIAVIVYSVKLNTRIVGLRSREGELKQMIAQFNEAAVQAEASAGHLKSVGTAAERNLRVTIERAQALRDDLSFLIERGDRVAGRMKRPPERPTERPLQSPTVRPVEPAPAERPPIHPPSIPDAPDMAANSDRAVEGLVDQFASRANPSLWLAAAAESSNAGPDDARAMIDQPGQPGPVAAPTGHGSRVASWLPGAASTAVNNPDQDAPSSSRSEAERELLDTLRKSGVRR
jgi:uncharacterized protein DUF6468